MSATTRQIEALKLISDLSKWIATIETGAIAVMGSMFKADSGMTITSTCMFMISISSFVLSIICTAGILVSLPAAIQDIQENEKIWERKATLGIFFPPLLNLIYAQFCFFLIGIITFGGGAIFVLWCK